MSLLPFNLLWELFYVHAHWFLSRPLSAEFLTLLKQKVKCCQPAPHVTWQTSVQTPDLEEEQWVGELHTTVQNKSFWRLLEATLSLPWFCFVWFFFFRDNYMEKGSRAWFFYVTNAIYKIFFFELPHPTLQQQIAEGSKMQYNMCGL